MTVAVLALGVANSVLLVAGREFPKPTRPREVAVIVARGTSESSRVVIGEASFHETVVGLTYLRELDHSECWNRRRRARSTSATSTAR